MRTVLIGSDFMYNSNGDLIPIEINTNVGWDNLNTRVESNEESLNLTSLLQFISDNGFTKIEYIGAIPGFYDELSKAVDIECKFICESLPCAMIGMNSDLMTTYIKFVADRLLVDLGYNKLFNATNPFDFMESISVEGKTNFFESRPTQYQKDSVMNKTRETTFDMNDEF
jgi:hypothetical protein